MKELLINFGEWLLSVVDHWELIVASGAIAFFIDLLDRLWEWKMPKKWYAIFVGVGFFLATFASWRAENEKIRTRETLMEVQVDAPYVPRPTGPMFGQRINVDFGIKNVGSYVANQEYSLQSAEIHDAAHPFDFEDKNPEVIPTSVEVENEVYDQFKQHKLSEKQHIERSVDPGQYFWVTARNFGTVSPSDYYQLVAGTKLLYTVGFVKWTDGEGTHEKRFCYWIHPPADKTLIFDQCFSHNDYLEKAED